MAELAETVEEGASTVTAPVEYPLEVDYCGVCTMPPEVTNLLNLHASQYCLSPIPFSLNGVCLE